MTLIVWLAAAFFSATPLAAQSAAEQRLDAALKTIQVEKNIVGFSVVVVKGNTVVFSKSYGVADIARRLPVTDSTLFRVASISKVITATALLQLYEQGKFKLDDDISHTLGYVVRNPNFPTVPITFRHLLSHTSSLTDYGNYDSLLSASYNGDVIPPLHAILTKGGGFYSNDTYLNAAPGTRFEYCNLGYGIIGTLVEKLSGERFDVYCRKHILDVLGIEASFNVRDLKNINNLSVLYRRDSAGVWQPQADNYNGDTPERKNLRSYRLGENALPMGPQGGLRISALGLSTLLLTFMNGTYNGKTLLRDDTWQLMMQNVIEGKTTDAMFKQYGLGIHTTRDLIEGETWIGHSGEAYGLLSNMYFNPNTRTGIIFVMNGATVKKGNRAFYDIEEAVFNAVYRILLK